MVSGRNKDIYEMDKVLSSGNSFSPQSREQPMPREPHNEEPLSLLVPSWLSQRGFRLRHSFVRRLMFNRVVFGPKCPYLVMISKAPFDTKMKHCKDWVPIFCPFASPPAKDHLFQYKIFMKSHKTKLKETLGPMPPGLMQMPDLYRWKGTSLFNASLLPHLIFYEFIHLLSLLWWWCCEWKG